MRASPKVRHPIGAKIFGATVVLLLLMAAVTYTATVNLHQLSRHLAALSDYYIPLDQTVSNIRASHLGQILHFERFLDEPSARTFAQLQQDAEKYRSMLLPCDRTKLRDTNQQVRQDYVAGSQRSGVQYAVLRMCSESDMEQAQALVARALADGRINSDPAQVLMLGEARAQLANIVRSREEMHATILRFLLEDRALDGPARAILKEQLEKARNEVSREAGTLSRLLQAHTRESARQAKAIESEALVFNWTATAVAVILGLGFTLLLTRSLLRPIRELLTGAKAVEEGDLSIQVKVHSADELALLAQSFNYMVSGLKEKENIKTTFGKYIDPRIVQTLIEDQAAGRIGDKRAMTVFFSDIEGFTTIGEELTPDGVVRLLNGYLGEMSQPILARRGIIDKYIGDAIMAFWGPPFVGEEEHALLACEVALDQLARLDGFRARLPDLTGMRKGIPGFNVRIGISTGEVTAGSVGSDLSRSYTVIGDTVNLASRLEALNKHYGTRIIISEATWSAVRDALETRELDRVRVAGRDQSARVFELLGPVGAVDGERLWLRDEFARGLAAYRLQHWDQAVAHFDACVARTGDAAARLFLERIGEMREHAPAANWNGVWTFSEK